MLDDFMVRAVLMLGMVACLSAPLGSLALWRKMGYFGDAASHAALFGVALALSMNISPLWGGLGVAVLMGFYLGSIDESRASADAILGVLAHGGLAGAVLLSSFMGNGRSNFEAFLYGDVLSTSKTDLLQVGLLTLVICGVLVFRFNKMLVSILNPELASAQGLKPRFEMRVFVILLAIAVAIAMKAVGGLLIGALLIIPALSARALAKSPEQMVFIALLITWASAAIGLWGSFIFDLPTGPAIACTAFFIFFLTRLRIL